MKKTMKLFLGLAVTLLIFSCSKNDDGLPNENSAITAEEAAINARMDAANDDMANIVEEEEANTYTNPTNGRMTENAVATFATCATVTRVPAFGTAITPGTLVTKTIDFGTTGCLLSNGNFVKGKIIISFTFQPGAPSHTITYTLDNFYHNGIKYVGTKTFTRVMTAATATSPSHPVVTMNMDITATFPNGNVYTRVGQRVREIVAGLDTPMNWSDNVYQVTGSWTTTYPNTGIQTSTITTPLLIKMSCVAVNKPLIVQGVITFVRNGNSATLDYGTGECDNSAVFTINGNAFTIIIGN